MSDAHSRFRATLTNTTVDDNESRLRYTGDWTTNNVTDFWGGSSAYTDTPLASVSLNFSGTSRRVPRVRLLTLLKAPLYTSMATR